MESPKFVITWSPSVDRRYHNLSWWYQKLELFPPFLQKKFPDRDNQGYEEAPSKSIGFEKTADDDITACGNLEFSRAANLNLREAAAEKISVPCWDDCGSRLACLEKLRVKLEEKSISAAEVEDAEALDVFKPHDDEDYPRFEEDFAEEEEEEEEVESKEKRLLWLDMCEGYSIPSSDVEEDPSDTIDPYMPHNLYLPYNRIPRPRSFKRRGKEVDYTMASLPRRPRSPVRKILPGKFDLKVAFERYDQKQRTSETRKLLEESKQRISQSIMQLSNEKVDQDVQISSVTLQAVCEKVVLTLMNAKINTDIHTFVNVAIIWALSELDLFNRDMLSDEQLRLSEDFLFCDYTRQNILGITGSGGLRKMLMGVYRPPFSRNIYTTLHPRLPWPYVSSSHERGHTKLYPTIRERIDEQVSKTTLENHSTSTYVSDVTCFHLRDVSDKSYTAYVRKSKFYGSSLNDSRRTGENLFVQLVSFT